MVSEKKKLGRTENGGVGDFKGVRKGLATKVSLEGGSEALEGAWVSASALDGGPEVAAGLAHSRNRRKKA